MSDDEIDSKIYELIRSEKIESILQKAFTNALNLGVNAEVLDKGIVEELLKKAQGQAQVLSSYVK